MSNRFYVNDVQIFGNNEMFPKTYKELKKQGAKWTDDGTFDAIEIKDPQSLMEAVEQDILGFLKDALTVDVYDKEKEGWSDKDFKDVHDKDILLSDWEDDFKYHIWDEEGEMQKPVWLHLQWWLNQKRVFTSYILYQAIKGDVDFKEGKLVLKEGHTITATMY